MMLSDKQSLIFSIVYSDAESQPQSALLEHVEGPWNAKISIAFSAHKREFIMQVK